MQQAQVIIPVSDFNAELDFFTHLGFRLNRIYPDDNPQMAEMDGFDLCVCLDTNAKGTPPLLQIKTNEEKDELLSPNGTRIQFIPATFSIDYPAPLHTFEVRKLRNEDPWIIGRAGMQYRDLLPGRLSGGIMASHIRIKKGGPVPDMVHFHTIGFQLIFCYKGWVKLVYEDQGQPFILKADDCVNQPPEIRHRVLESSDNLEVIEIGVPAVHMTSIDHNMILPNDQYNPGREFQGQRFCRHIKKEAQLRTWLANGFLYRDSGIKEATKNVADVVVITCPDGVKQSEFISHQYNICFNFVLSGMLEIEVEGHDQIRLHTGEAFVIPPEKAFKFFNCNPDLELLQVNVS